MALVVPVAAIAGPTTAAWATGLSSGASDTSGNYAVCSLIYYQWPHGSTFTSDYGYLNLIYGVPEADVEAYAVDAYCNTSWSGGVYGPFTVSLQPGSAFISSGLSTVQVTCQSNVSSTGCTNNSPATGSEQMLWGSEGDGSYVSLQCMDAAFQSTGTYAALSSSSKTVVQADTCGATPAANWRCSTKNLQSGTPGFNLASQCSVVSVSSVSSETVLGVSANAPEPYPYWAGQVTSVPGASPPVVTCAHTFNASNLTLEATSTATANGADTGDVLTYDWSFNDGSTDGTTANVVHTYSGAPPVGGWQVVETVTATGDGVHNSGTAVNTLSIHGGFGGRGDGCGGLGVRCDGCADVL